MLSGEWTIGGRHWLVMNYDERKESQKGRCLCKRKGITAQQMNARVAAIIMAIQQTITSKYLRKPARVRLSMEEEFMSHGSSFLLPTPKENSSCGSVINYALVILNQHLPKFVPLLWEHAQLRVCADGGANRLYDEMPLLLPPPHRHHTSLVPTRFTLFKKTKTKNVSITYKPDVIKGDMDSIRTDVLEFYTKLGTRIIDESHDQDTTDLHKCITYIRDLTPDIDKSKLCILVTGALGGRFDHEIGNINVLCRFSDTRIILLSDDCLIRLLPRNHHHKIFIQSSVEGPHCGLIPIGMPCGSSTTTGLQWDLNDTEMRFGGLVSTSNIVKGDIVTVQSDSDLLWTISIKKP